MRVAWLAPHASGRPEPYDDTALVIRALRARHAIVPIDEPHAHDFVWQHAREPFELCVFELGGTSAHQFVVPYAMHFPGVVILRGLPRHDRALQAARLVVVPHEPVAQALADDYPAARVRTLTPGVEPLPHDAPPVVNALRWPPDGTALSYAISAFAARRAVIVFDGPETADWPSLDPQNWELRNSEFGARTSKVALRSSEDEFPVPRSQFRVPEPICVSIDPRDEAHSLRLALRRLEQDASLRERLGNAAQAWWRANATVQLAADGLDALMNEARTLADPPRCDVDDDMRLAKRILDDFGLRLSTIGLEPPQ
jgi:hypothetical protein